MKYTAANQEAIPKSSTAKVPEHETQRHANMANTRNPTTFCNAIRLECSTCEACHGTSNKNKGAKVVARIMSRPTDAGNPSLDRCQRLGPRASGSGLAFCKSGSGLGSKTAKDQNCSGLQSMPPLLTLEVGAFHAASFTEFAGPF